jgi:septation ring formation regulator EzrA
MLSIEEINELEKRNEINVKQYNSLLKQYNEVLRLAKENADSMERCCQELEKRLEPFQDDYFRGLNEKQIAELAKKSIRLTQYNRKLEDCLEEIQKVAKNNLELGVIIPGGWLEQKIDEVLND